LQIDTNLLTQLVRAKHACLLRLRGMGQKQLELIEEGNMTGLLDLLSAKQRPLSELRQIEQALGPFRAQDPEQRRWSSPEARDACARTANECENVLREILKREKQCETELVRRRDEAAVRLQGFHVAGQARGAYTGGSARGISQLDLQVT
jgi:hypothetical protein